MDPIAANLVEQNKFISKTSVAGQNSVDKDAFMRLLLAQMRHQDPLEPIDNREMLSQMAQFTSLEQLSNMNENMTAFNQTAAFMNAAQFLGKTVMIPNPNTDPNAPAYLTTKVKAISYAAEGPKIGLENGLIVGVGDLLAVSN